MGYYFVDYENVKMDGLNGINKLEPSDKVCIFYSEHADTLTFDLHKRINESKATITFQKVEVGSKNALDFQLVTFLGYEIAGKKEDEYYIVSKDAGYNSVCIYWKRKKIGISIVANLTRLNITQEQQQLLQKVVNLVNDKEIAKVVTDFIIKYKTKQGIYNALLENYKNKQGIEIYQAIKPLLKDKKGE
ncbi:PIN domain-containing protein [Trichococcus alkaliphilus]|uniref:PIN domain-containing protein n=1 Tax=Trichococcus alkaliphilus TaxID=2052943 RepID=UPI000D0B77CA|nr:PIN domain-containing protein [Trichococcus alkaliphilus]